MAGSGSCPGPWSPLPPHSQTDDETETWSNLSKFKVHTARADSKGIAPGQGWGLVHFTLLPSHLVPAREAMCSGMWAWYPAGPSAVPANTRLRNLKRSWSCSIREPPTFNSTRFLGVLSASYVPALNPETQLLNPKTQPRRRRPAAPRVSLGQEGSANPRLRESPGIALHSLSQVPEAVI